MNILITGATGFVGGHLVNELKQSNNIYFLLRKKDKEIHHDNNFYFNSNIEELHSYILENEIEGIIHLASLFLSSHSEKDVKSLIDSNVYLGTAILESAINSQVRWFLNIGTFWQHFAPDSSNYNPVNLYAATKQAFIDMAKYYEEISNIKFVTLKICDTYGPNDTRSKIFNIWNRIAETGEELPMSPGEQYMDILHINDVISGIIHLTEMLDSDQKLYDSYALYSDKRFKIKDLAIEFERITEKKLNIIWGGRRYREREVMIPWLLGNKL
ncbi:MAG: NAD-dependent epimerase/dehydratase family protein, partial [Prevotella sp.]|nr:NAD-dependent epimerase/dehydratase family protein [Prevotella sp.]